MTAKILRRLSAEPAYSAILYKILVYCTPARLSSDVERTILSFPEMKGGLQSPLTLLGWLEEAGGIEQIPVNEQESMWSTTMAGRSVVETESYENRLVRLLDQETHYGDIYWQVLKACLSPKSRIEIESILSGTPVLENSGILPSFFIESLEKAGGLSWDKKWITTEAGKDLLKIAH
ncbi:hypothetical protein DesLBE_2241 [Desulfitobacterium sp. LBE]|uniref:Uncharacterized protein n=1 Tax=Desulfitobacterium hafniense TaxID=49338 RepID=A0A098B9D7_DESHA|nr:MULTISPECIES: hypothetical protein [Desulfitobacterium]TWH57945.1 hypothetical protein DesLBE_2241 [Desulfitobacterium sp. LBE]CDX04471.1 Hypothetical protein DPCES_4585 [Desulfitobacterium hafniense]